MLWAGPGTRIPMLMTHLPHATLANHTIER
jgi:hypothetical protein